jgi:uncharacterized membrane protein
MSRENRGRYIINLEERNMEFINRVLQALTELHPTHPMFVHFPIALTGAAFLFILLAYWRNSPALEQTAFANIALASLSTIVAGITGFMDNIKNYVGDAPNSTLKIILAIVLFLLTTGISILRYRNPAMFQKANSALYIGTYGLSFAIALVLAFLGGVILYGF